MPHTCYLDSIRDAFHFEKQVQGWGRAKRGALMEDRREDLPELARTAKPRTEASTQSPTLPDGD